MAPDFVPAPAVPPPEPASWLRVWKRGSVAYQAGLPQVPLVGWLECATYATNLDAIIDWGAATFPNDVTMYAGPWVQGLAGCGKTYLGRFTFQPSAGIISSTIFVPGTCYMMQPAGLNSLQFILHAGGVAGIVWGLDLGLLGVGFGESVQNLLVTGIAHGREL